jgi:predicted amidophosphoribosyltransferase
MATEKGRCMVCGKEKEMTDAICDLCKAEIRGEAVDKQKQIKKDAERELRKEGVKPEKK